MDWDREKNVDQLLNIFERVNKEFPIANLRWTIAHLNDASATSFQRMKAIGVGCTMQDMMYNDGDQVVAKEAADYARRMPPGITAKTIDIVVSASTNAHRRSTYT